MGPRRAATTTFFGLALLSAPASAAPTGDKQACVDAATRGQIQRDDGKLAAAAEAFTACSVATCPAAVRKSCGEWLDTVRASMPTATVHLPDAEGAHLTIDGKEASFDVATTLDPGLHKLRVESPRRSSIEQEVTLVAGDRKTVALTFPDARPVPPPDVVTRPIPTAAWIAGGVAAGGLAAWAVFGIMAKLDTDRLSKECAPTCSQAARDSAFRTASIADLGLVIGVVAAAVTGVLVLTRPTYRRPATSASVALGEGGLVFR
jgi:hypothetical protein